MTALFTFVIGVIVGGAVINFLKRNNNSYDRAAIQSRSTAEAENLKLRRRVKSLEEELEKKSYLNNHIRQQESHNLQEDFKEDLDIALQKNKQLKANIEHLSDQLDEYKTVCESYERRLKENGLL